MPDPHDAPGDSLPQEQPLRRSCGTMEAFFSAAERDPQYRFNQAAIDGITRAFMRAGASAMRAGIITIPVVVHVVFRTDSENISDQQVHSQIDVLNADFTATNGDLGNVPPPFRPLIGNPQIRFSLASEDPTGSPTSGITRTPTTRQSFGIAGEPVKFANTGGTPAWDTSRYLNLWACSLSGTLLGYAQFPGGPPETDGVVIRNTAFGTVGSARAPFDLGRTATHEVGHYLNLSHIWGEERIPNCNDTDFVADTPNQFGENTNKPAFPTISCNNGPNGDMFMNYMDYVDDDTMFMFTLDQVARMRATLSGPRSGLG
jgi:hypothetical protein